MMKNIIKYIEQEEIAFWVFLFPAFLCLFVFIIIPTIISFCLSFFQWDLLNPLNFVGLKNYIELVQDANFYKILSNTFVFAVATTVLGVIIPLVLASIINRKIRGSEFFKVAYFIPFVTPMIVIALVWEWIFDPNMGLINYILRTNIAWLYDVNFAMPAIIIVSVWRLIGYNMIIFLTGLTAINQNIFDAAKIDGANNLKIFLQITVPMVKSTIFFVVIITIISSFQVFDLIFLMTKGNPLNSTNVLVYWLYQNAFEYFDTGKASAIAYILFILVFILTLLQLEFTKKYAIDEEID